jgi:hypothetical protein
MKFQYAWRVITIPGFVLSQVRDLGLHLWAPFSSDPFARVYRTVRPYTMSGFARLRGLYDAVTYVTAHGIAGDVVECGTARGGSAAVLGLAMKSVGMPRTLWVFDTFEGIPAPTSADPDHKIAAPFTGKFRGELTDVTALFERLGILKDARLIKGRFEETLPRTNIAAIAVLHIDGDWYDSVKACLDHLYDRVTPGGIIHIDDYGHWEGARRAVDEFLATRGISAPLQYIDYTGRQLVKP